MATKTNTPAPLTDAVSWGRWMSNGSRTEFVAAAGEDVTKDSIARCLRQGWHFVDNPLAPQPEPETPEEEEARLEREAEEHAKRLAELRELRESQKAFMAPVKGKTR